MKYLTEEEILENIEDRGLAVEEGDRIDGPFIPDGIVRIYDPNNLDVWADGKTLIDAFENLI